MIDINKPLRAKIYDADNWHESNCMEVDVQIIVLPHPPYTEQPAIIYNGGRSESFDFLPQDLAG